MKITQAQARMILYCMDVTHSEARLHYSDILTAIELAKFAGLSKDQIASWQKMHDEEKAYAFEE